MATVYLARARGARGFERHVALKVMHPHLAEDQEFVDMFLDEAGMAANIRHPNVVSTLDVVEEDRQLFLVMEYVEGPALQAVVRTLTKRHAVLPVECTLRIMLDVLAGLHAAHEQTAPNGSPMNMVHRDVSPHNVLVGVDGVARIMDFGVARAENRHNSTMGANPKGKLPYMAPEQMASLPLDRRADVYAAGIVLWELLTGRGLFRADNDGALMHQVIHGATQSPSDINAAIPKAISAVCMQALQLRPDFRFPTTAHFAEALERAAKEAHIEVAPPRVVGALIKEIAPEKSLSSTISSSPGGDSGSPRSNRTPARSGYDAASTHATAPLVINGSAPVSLAVEGLTSFGPTPSTMTSDARPSGQSGAPATGLRSRPGVLVGIGVAGSLVVGALIWLLVGGAGASPPAGMALPDASASVASVAAALPTPSTEKVPGTLPAASSSAQVAASASTSTKSTKAPTNRVGPPAPRTGSKTFRPEEP